MTGRHRAPGHQALTDAVTVAIAYLAVLLVLLALLSVFLAPGLWGAA